MIRRQALIDAAKMVLEMAGEYKGRPHREMTLDGMLYGVLKAKFGVKRQHSLHFRSGGQRAKRIDFRHGGTNPVVIEFAVRTERHKIEVYGRQNQSELHKLTRQVAAKARYLLLLDIARSPIPKPRLIATYGKVKHERGGGKRTSVRVIYVHKTTDYSFLWR